MKIRNSKTGEYIDLLAIRGFSPTIIENENNNENSYKLDITTADGSFTTPNLKGGDVAINDTSSSATTTYSSSKIDELLQEIVNNFNEAILNGRG